MIRMTMKITMKTPHDDDADDDDADDDDADADDADDDDDLNRLVLPSKPLTYSNTL